MATVTGRLVSWFRGTETRGGGFIETRANAGGLLPPWRVGKAEYNDPRIATYDQEGYRKVALMFRCVQYLSNAAGSAPLRIYAEERAGERRYIEPHPFRDLVSKPNEDMGESRFFAFVAMVATITGFCVVEKERDVAGRVIGLHPLRSDWLRSVPRQRHAPDWEYRIPGFRSPFLLKAEDVVVYTFADTVDQRSTGLGPLHVLLREIGISNALTDFLKTFLDRGALPLYYAIPSDEPQHKKAFANQGAVNSFRDTFESEVLHAGRSVLLTPAIKDIRPLGFDMNELAYKQLHDLSDSRICEAFGLHPILVGAPIGLEHGTYSNYEQARRGFYEDTMRFQWSRMDDAFTRQLLPEFVLNREGARYGLEFDVSDLPALQDDENERTTRAVSMFTAGLVSRHPAQREAGVAVHGPDEFLIPFSAIPTPVAAPGTNDRGTGAGSGTRSAYAHLVEPLQLTAGVDEVQLRAEVDRCPPGETGPTFTLEGRLYANTRALPEAEVRARLNIAAAGRRRQGQLANQLRPALEDYFEAQRDRVVNAYTGERALQDLDRLGWGLADVPLEERADHHLETAEADVDRDVRAWTQLAIDWNDEARLLEDLLKPWWNRVSASAFDDMARAINDKSLVWAISNPRLQAVRDVLGYRIVGITETTRGAVETIVREGLINGTSPRNLAKELSGLYDETYRNRSLTIARTEGQVAYNLSSGAAAEESGVVSRMQLHDNMMHTTDAGSDGLTCAQRNGLQVTFADLPRHVEAEHPNGTLATSPVIASPLGVV